MKILVLNCGSSSLKYRLFDMDEGRVMAKGMVERIGQQDQCLTHYPNDKDKVVICAAIPNHSVAISYVISALLDKNHGVLNDMREIDAVGHRVVHGGANFHTSVLVDEAVISELTKLIELAPLHNAPAVTGIRACKEIISVPMVAVFDTSFHHTIPKEAYLYAIPYEYYEKHAIRRYGFHGTSHRYVNLRAAELFGKDPEELKMITCHLGNGSSITAIDKGKVINTSMGFTPLAGVIMGTRSGDIDPAIVTFLMEKENLTPDQMNNLLNKKSGVLGISGLSNDMRDIEDAISEGNERAQLAFEMFNRQLLRYIGAYIAELNGLDALVFTAGIGENGPETRKSICDNLSYMGLKIDEEKNKARGKEVEISSPDSKVKVFVIPTNEELMIARDTLKLVQKLNNSL